MAEWLGTGLQNPLQRFESASDLRKKPLSNQGLFLLSYGLMIKRSCSV